MIGSLWKASGTGPCVKEQCKVTAARRCGPPLIGQLTRGAGNQSKRCSNHSHYNDDYHEEKHATVLLSADTNSRRNTETENWHQWIQTQNYGKSDSCMERPSKRPKTGSTSHDHNGDHAVEDELSMNPVQFTIEQDPLYELDKGRANAASRLKSRFESIFEKYERDFTGIGDEIDFHTGEVVVNNGHLEAFLNEDDFISEDEYYSDEVSSVSDADEGPGPDHSPLSHVEPAPLSDPINVRDKWILPDDLPEFTGLDLPRNSNGNGHLLSPNGGTQPALVLQPSQNYGRQFLHAPPKLNPGLLQYDSYGRARQQSTLSDMLDREKRSRFTKARSFVQAQKSASAIGNLEPMTEALEDFEGEAEIAQMRVLMTEYSSTALPSSQDDGQPTSAQSTLRRSDSEQPVSRLMKKLKDLHTNPNVYKVKKSRTVKFPKSNRRLKGRANKEPAAGDGIPKRKRGRPRKITAAGDELPKRKRGRPRKTVVAGDGGSESGVLPSLSTGNEETENHEGADSTELQKPTLSKRTKSGRHHKRPEFYGDIISTLEIEQILLESDEDDSAEDTRNVQPEKASQPLPWRIFEPVIGRGNSKSPGTLSQRIIRDSQEPASSIPRSSAPRLKSTQSPQKIHQKVIRDSQDPCSSLPSSLTRHRSSSPLKLKETTREVFSRNNIDSSYGFSDDDEGDVGVFRRRRTPEEHLIQPSEKVDMNAADPQHDFAPEEQVPGVDMQADHPTPAHSQEEVGLHPEEIETLDEMTFRNPSPKIPIPPDTILFTSSSFAPIQHSLQPDSMDIETISKHDTWAIEMSTEGTLYSARRPDAPREEHSPSSDAPPLDSITVHGGSFQGDPIMEIGTNTTDSAAGDALKVLAYADASIPRENSLPRAKSPAVQRFTGSPQRLSPEKTDEISNEALQTEASMMIQSTPTQPQSTSQRRHPSPSKRLSPEKTVDVSHVSLHTEGSTTCENSLPQAPSPSAQQHPNSPKRSSQEQTADIVVKLVTPEAPRMREGIVKTSSGSRRRVLALSNLIPEQMGRDGEEDELNLSSPVRHSSSLFRGLLSRSSALSGRRSSTPNGRPTPDPSKKSRGSHAESAVSTVNPETQDFAQTPIRKMGFGFANARGAAPRRMSLSSGLSRIRTPLSTTGSTSASATVVVSRPKSSLEPTSPSRTTQISPLAQRTLTAHTTSTGTVTARSRKRKLREAMSELDNNDNNFDEEELVQTPGGTVRRCGKGGFTCDRDFCMVCCV